MAVRGMSLVTTAQLAAALTIPLPLPSTDWAMFRLDLDQADRDRWTPVKVANKTNTEEDSAGCWDIKGEFYPPARPTAVSPRTATAAMETNGPRITTPPQWLKRPRQQLPKVRVPARARAWTWA